MKNLFPQPKLEFIGQLNKIGINKKISIEEMVNDYLNQFADSLDTEILFFESRPSLAEAISRAAMAETSSGKRCRHQPAYNKLFFPEKLDEARQYLLEIEEQVRTCKTFDKLHGLVKKALGRVSQNAVLYVYDTAWKVGAKLRLEPEAVYLHAGTRKGAKALGIDVKRRDFIEVHELPAPLQRLRPIHIENFLCIYKDQLGNGFTDKNLPIRGC